MSDEERNESPDSIKQEGLSNFSWLISYCHRTISAPEIKVDDKRAIIIVALFSKMIQHATCAVELQDEHYYCEAEIITRCNFEALFYMAACTDSIDFYRKYMATSEAELIKLRNVVNDPGRTYTEDVRKSINEMASELGSHAEKLTAEAAARSANLACLYDYAYRIYSPAVHTEPGYLFTHYVQCTNETVEGINFGQPPQSASGIVTDVNLILCVAIQRYLAYFNLPCDPHFTCVSARYLEDFKSS